MNPLYVNLAVEDELSEAALRRILQEVSPSFQVRVCYGKQGIGYLKRTIEGFNKAAKGLPYIVLADLDREQCPPHLVKKWVKQPIHPHLIFRIAVREIETWLLADQQGLTRFLGLSPSAIPTPVEEILDPKRELIALARKSKKRKWREAIVPPPGSTKTQGSDYNAALRVFVDTHWDIGQARLQAPSLDKAWRAIEALLP